MYSYATSIVWNQAGQPRAYADTIYDFEIFLYRAENDLPWETWDPNEEFVVTQAKLLGHNWDDEGRWPGPRLGSKTKIAPGHWRFRVICDFTD